MIITKTRAAIQAVIKRFYYEHHDKIKMETDLVDEVNGARVTGFTETKRRVVEALDFRIDNLTKGWEAVKKELPNDSFGWQARIDELETFRHYVKGMVIKADE